MTASVAAAVLLKPASCQVDRQVERSGKRIGLVPPKEIPDSHAACHAMLRRRAGAELRDPRPADPQAEICQATQTKHDICPIRPVGRMSNEVLLTVRGA